MTPNPELIKHVLQLILQKSKKIEFMIAAGGGSVIDFTKIPLAFFSKQKDYWKLMSFKQNLQKNLPFGCVQTCPGSGTESNNALVLSNKKLKKKDTFYNLNLYPKFSVLDPQLTFNLPIHQTCIGIADMCMFSNNI